LIGDGTISIRIFDIQSTARFGSAHALIFSQIFGSGIDPNIGIVEMSFSLEFFLQLVGVIARNCFVKSTTSDNEINFVILFDSCKAVQNRTSFITFTSGAKTFFFADFFNSSVDPCF